MSESADQSALAEQVMSCPIEPGEHVIRQSPRRLEGQEQRPRTANNSQNHFHPTSSVLPPVLQITKAQVMSFFNSIGYAIRLLPCPKWPFFSADTSRLWQAYHATFGSEGPQTLSNPNLFYISYLERWRTSCISLRNSPGYPEAVVLVQPVCRGSSRQR